MSFPLWWMNHLWVILRHTTNLHRQHRRPKDPKDLDFELNLEYIPEDFCQADVTVGDRRHIIMYTTKQMSLLKKSKRWYIDATFKVVKAPFSLLFSIHAFLKHGDCTKQVPLLYALMSGKRAQDYKAIFKALKKSMKHFQIEAVMDFEAGMWSGFRAMFPCVRVKGCVFHWVQAVWRHIQGVGLQEAYNKDAGTHTFLRKLMALPFIPHEHVLRVFLQLASLASDEKLKQICTYIHNTWISGNIWPPSAWSVFQQNIRTNNVEGWHHKLNKRAGRGQI